MATKSLSQFKSQLAGGGARPNLFEVSIPSFPDAVATSDWSNEYQKTFKFLCKAAQLPASTVSPITVPFRGRNLKVAGDRTFAPWTVTIINDTTMDTRNALERWMNGINAHTANTGLTNPVDYQADLVVEQLDKDGTTTKTYNFRGAFPTAVGSISVSYDNADVIEEFDCEFAVQYWESNTTS